MGHGAGEIQRHRRIRGAAAGPEHAARCHHGARLIAGDPPEVTLGRGNGGNRIVTAAPSE